MATRCRTSFFGTSKFGMIRGMREAAAIRGVTLEFQVRIRQSAADLLTLRRPAIITAEVNGAGHAMVLLDISRDGKRLIIGDPLQHALLRITPERLAQHYQFTGDVLIVTRR